MKVIKSIQSNGDFDTQHGKLYAFEYLFEDGDSGYCNHKTPASPFQVGQSVFVTDNGVTPRGDKKIKVNKDDQSQFNNAPAPRTGETQDQIMRQSTLHYACIYYTGRVATENDVIATAARWYNYAKTGDITLTK